ncbi:Na(+)/H(+) antiporter subunit B [Hyphococcus flavus]|uniref:Na(+)/H(+) antiporter subunit B n=1 Tax=Hyphococcus flavus TaxID=1866326 RepID=A0AAF0CHS9_9PROT|nr:Na(+)/H(+) antiporter subunit B [Hyphococcus flavus]WDI32232.1 Na(+)/H(+) antiporter subunit B [Hyphococcus flavus]
MDHLILKVTTKLLFAPIILFALYVQFHGDYGPGGGFQAGVIFAVAFILHAFCFGLAETKKVLPQKALTIAMVLGLMFYAGTGVATLLLGGNFLAYTEIDPQSTHHAGQHYGILLVEWGVGVTVASTMLTIFYHFTGREPDIDQEDW